MRPSWSKKQPLNLINFFLVTNVLSEDNSIDCRNILHKPIPCEHLRQDVWIGKRPPRM